MREISLAAGHLSGTTPTPPEIQHHVEAIDRAMLLARFSAEGRFLGANRLFLDRFGYDLAEIVDAPHELVCPPSRPEAHQQHIELWRTLRAGKHWAGLVERVARDGRSVWLEATYAPRMDEHGHLQSVLAVSSDVSLRVEHERVQSKRLWQSLVVDETDSAVIVTDGAWRIVYVNAGFVRMFGYQLEEIHGRRPIALLVPNVKPAVIEEALQCANAGRPFKLEELTWAKDGQRFWNKLIINPVRDAHGTLVNTVSVVTDITEAKMHEIIHHRGLDAMAREIPVVDLMTMICQEVERISPEVVASILAVDENNTLHALAAPSLPERFSVALEGMPSGPQEGSCGTAAWRHEEVVVTDIEHDPLWTRYAALAASFGLKACWSTPIISSKGQVVGTFAFYYREKRGPDEFHRRLVSVCVNLCALALEREAAREQIRKLAFYDSLTGLPNRSLLLAKAEQAIAGAARDRTQLAVLFIDLDRFKQINDTLGHTVGDEVLRLAAQRLSEGRRGSDIVGRLAGDEFVLVLPQCDARRVADVAEQILQGLGRPHRIGDATHVISASVGISLYPGNGEDIETLLRRADIAMYEAKAGNRGSYSFFSNEMNLRAQERLALENALREAIEQQQLRLHYQPQVMVEDGRLYGVEALARWHHPVLGEISPARFIPLAEESGLIGNLGLWVLEEACRQLADWQSRGIAVPSVAVNLSPTSFHNVELPDIISALLARYQLEPARLMLEITENVLIDGNAATLDTIQEVHALGVKLSMDDFGTGYSSLSYLRRLPVSELKLDKSFVHDLAHDQTAQALSEAVIRIGESLNLVVVAEGVEDEKQLKLLRQQGFHVIQGFYLAKPLPAPMLEGWLQKRTANV
ncbi:diguanylate cyclase (GGDEF)-like protein/PAS domain S-box-containing protein [Silvimonas terrae]|uniref:Diguanylate cyclase (GGDEF)-like protein/PAS domain S-box-containing protein n=1 Tax=Silvimonas terrae TaxID=300266 RepID=A0A840RB29_9NEIS|nr:EAL domain-containing protein [Silvimonas terrae]MBB5190117.1 diguanylate cyclase (GGDEF)-like protein/PAS domain S-box-containing protein [Silvimonas terrae]